MENKQKLIITAILLLSFTSLASAQSNVLVEGLENENVNATFVNDTAITFETSYLEKTLNPRQVFTPDDLKNYESYFSYSLDTWDGGNGVASINLEYKVYSNAQYPNRSLEALLGENTSVKDYPPNLYQYDSSGYWNESDNVGKVFSGNLTDDRDTKGPNDEVATRWKVDIESHLQNININYELQYNSTNPSNSTEDYGWETVWTGEDTYSGEEPNLFPIEYAGTRTYEQNGEKKQLLNVRLDNKFRDQKQVTAVLAHKKEFSLSKLNTNLQPIELDNASKWYDEAESRVINQNLSEELLIQNQTDYEFHAYNLTLPKDSEVPVTAEILTGSPRRQEGIKMYIIGSIAGTTTYNASQSTGILDSVEDGDISEYYNNNGGFEASNARSYSGSWSVLSPTTSDNNGDSPKLERNFTDINPPTMQTAMYSTDEAVKTNWRYNGTRIINIGQNWFQDKIVVNGVKVGDPALNKWYLMELKKINWDTDTIGEVYVNGNLEATDVAFESSAPAVNEVNLVHTGGSVSDEGGYYDVFTVGENNPPIIDNIDTDPTEWVIDVSTDIALNATEPDGDNMTAYYLFEFENGTTIVDWTQMSTGTASDFVANDAFTPSTPANYSLRLKVNDTQGLFNESNTTQEVFNPLNNTLNSPDNDSTELSPVDFLFTPKCYSSGGCTQAELYFNVTEDVTKSWITDTESDWLSGTFTNTTTDGNGNLTLNSSSLGLSESENVTSDGSQYITVNTQNSYSNPIVFATSNTRNGAEDPQLTKVKNVQSSQFDIKFCEHENTDGGCDQHTNEQIGYLVAEVSTLDDLSGVEAGTVTLGSGSDDSGSAKTINFDETFSSSAIVVATQQTQNEAGESTPQVPNTGTGSFDLYQCDHDEGATDSCETHGTETFAWVAIDPGASLPDWMEAGTTSQIQDSGFETQSLSKFNSAPSVMATINGNSGAQEAKPARVKSVTASNADVGYCEHDGSNVCDGHNGEVIGWMATAVGVRGGFFETGNFTSAIFDAGSTSELNASQITSYTPAGTDYNISYGENSTGTFQYYDDISNVPRNRYFKFNISLSTNDSSNTPKIDTTNISYTDFNETTFTSRKIDNSVANNTVNTITYDFENFTLPQRFRWNVKVTQSVGNSVFADNDRYLTVKGFTPVNISEPAYNKTPINVRGDTIRISTNATSDDPITSVNITLDNADGVTKVNDQSMINDTNDVDRWYYDYNPPEEPGSIGEWTTTVTAEDSSGNTGTNSSNFKVLDNVAPLWRNLSNNATNNISSKDTSINLTAEFRDNEGGFYKSIVSTNESGSFVNSSSAVTGSPNIFSNQTETWLQSSFTWADSTFDGLLGYKVWGRDKAGNYNLTDTGIVDINNFPVVDEPVIDPPTPGVDNGFTVKVNVTDINNNTQEVRLNLTNAVGTKVLTQAQMNNDSQIVPQWSYSYNPDDINESIGQWTADIIAEDTRGLTDTNTTDFTVIDDVKPISRNLSDDTTANNRIIAGNSVIITAEFLDNQTGMNQTVLATNETGVFENKTGIYGSPQTEFFSSLLYENSDWTTDASFYNTTARHPEYNTTLIQDVGRRSGIGLEAWLPMKETSGDILDYSQSGTSENDITPSNVQYGAVGVKDTNGLRFIGQNNNGDSYAAIQNHFYNSQGAISEITVCAWVNGTQRVPGGSGQFIASYDRNEYWRLSWTDDQAPSSLAWDTFDGASSTTDDFWYNATGNNSIYDGEKHHVCGWYDADANPNKKIILDGEVVNSTNAHNGNNLGSGNTRYGFLSAGSEATSFDGSRNGQKNLNGTVDDYRRYSNALSMDQLPYVTRGNYTGDIINSTKEARWETLNVNAIHIPSGANLDAVFQAVNNSNTSEVIDQQVIDISEGDNSYDLSVNRTGKARVLFNGTTQEADQTWAIANYTVDYGQEQDKFDWVNTEFTWQNKSIDNATIGYRIWGEDVRGNWNVSTTGTFTVGTINERDLTNIMSNILSFDRDSTYNRDFIALAQNILGFDRDITYQREGRIETLNNLTFDATRQVVRDLTLQGVNNLVFDRDVNYTRTGAILTQNLLRFDRTYYLDRDFQLETQNNLSFDSIRRPIRTASIVSLNTLGFDRDIIYQRDAQAKTTTDLVFDRTYDLARSFIVPTQVNLVFDRTRVSRRDADLLALVNLEFDRDIDYKREGTVQTEVDLEFVDTRRIMRDLQLEIQNNLSFERIQIKFREASVSTQSNLEFDRTVTYTRNFITQVLNTLTFNAESEPNIRNVEIEVDSLGDGRDILLNVNITDDDGLNKRRTLEYEDTKIDIPDGTGQIVELNISDELSHNGTITVVDNAGLKDKWELEFNLTDNEYSGTGDNLSLQTLTKNDTFNLERSREPTDYDIEHEVFSGTVETGGTFTGTLTAPATISLDTQATGDFLVEDREWVQNEDKLSTVEKQYIREKISIENLIGIQWNDITIPKRDAPTGFGSCDNCSDRVRSFSGNYFEGKLNLDTGDAILESFDKNIEDVVIGERETYFEQYRYVPESSVTLTDIQETVVINDSEYDFGSYIQVARTDRTFDNGTLKVDEEPGCDGTTPDFTEGQFYGDTWKACSEDNNGNIKPEFFKVKIQRIDTTVFVRYGGFKGTPPEDAVKPFLGLKPCKPLGNTHQTQDGSTLVCYDPPQCSVDSSGVTCGRDDDGSSDNVYLLERNIIRRTVDTSLTVVQIFEAIGFATMVLLVTGTWLYRKEFGEYPPGIRRLVKQVRKLK